jgi:hypothetical protein
VSAVTELVSPLPLEECRRRLQEQMDGPMTLFGKRPVIGIISGTTLRARKRVAHRNSFYTRLVVKLRSDGNEMVVSCWFGMHPFVIAFMIVWFAIALFGVGGLAIPHLMARALDGRPGAWFALLVPIGMLTFGAVLLGGGRYLARGERAFLTGFVRDALEAKPRT